MGCGCSGMDSEGAGKKDAAGTAARQSGLGRDVVGSGLKPTKAGKTEKKSYLSVYFFMARKHMKVSSTVKKKKAF